MIIGNGNATNVEQLISVLKELTLTADPRDTFVLDAKTGDPVNLQLRENKLSDGSITYDILVG